MKVSVFVALTMSASPVFAQSDPQLIICTGGKDVGAAILQLMPAPLHFDPSGPPTTMVVDETPASAGLRVTFTIFPTGRFTSRLVVQGWLTRAGTTSRIDAIALKPLTDVVAAAFRCPDVP